MSLLAEDRIWKQGAEVWEVNIKWRTFAVFTHFGTGSKRNATYSKTADWTKWRPCSLVATFQSSPAVFLIKRGQTLKFPGGSAPVVPRIIRTRQWSDRNFSIAKTGGVDELPGYGKNAVPSGRRLEICTVFYNMQVTTCSSYYIWRSTQISYQDTCCCWSVISELALLEIRFLV